MTELTTIEPTKLSVEGLRVAESYLMHCHDSSAVASHLGLDKSEVDRILKTREVREYIDRLFMESGFRNRETMFSTLDDLINGKLEQMREDEMTTDKDIADLLLMAHKMKMEEMKLQIKLMEVESSRKIQTQVNTQVNIDAGGKNYQALLGKLMNGME